MDSPADPTVDAYFLREAAEEAQKGILRKAGGPFGAVIVQDQRIIAKACNEVLARKDPTAHAEMLAIREASRFLGRPHLNSCVLYTTCYPCPMCLGAVLWARINTVVYALRPEDAAQAGFDDAAFYRQIKSGRMENTPLRNARSEAVQRLMHAWRQLPDQQLY